MKVVDTIQRQAKAVVEIQDGDLYFDVKNEEEFDINEKIRAIFDAGDTVEITIKKVVKEEDDK